MIGDPLPLIRREGRDVLNRHGHAIRAIGDTRRQADEDECRDGKHSPTAGDGVNEPSGESARDEQDEIKE